MEKKLIRTKLILFLLFVIPAKAGSQKNTDKLDSRLRGNDNFFMINLFPLLV
jgi:hypothetical protein